MSVVTEVKENSIFFMDKGQQVLRMTESIEKDDAQIELEGTLRGDTAYAFGDELITLALLKKNMTINMEKAMGLSSLCCSQLLAVQQTIDNNEAGSLKLVKLPDPLMEKLDASGLSQLLQIEA